MGEWFAAGFEHHLGGGARGAAGGVDLLVVVEFDNLDVIEVAGGLAGELHHEDGAEGEVGGEDGPDAAVRAFGFQPGEELRGVAGGADDEADATSERGFGKARGPFGVGEVDDEVGLRLVEAAGRVIEDEDAIEGGLGLKCIEVGDGRDAGSVRSAPATWRPILPVPETTARISVVMVESPRVAIWRISRGMAGMARGDANGSGRAVRPAAGG